MEIKEKVSLMLKAALEYNSAIIVNSVQFHAIKNPDRKTQRAYVKQMQSVQKNYMNQLNEILTQLEEEVS